MKSLDCYRFLSIPIFIDKLLREIVFGPAGLVWGGGNEIGVGLPWIHFWKYGYNHNFLGSNVNNINNNNNGIHVFSAKCVDW